MTMTGRSCFSLSPTISWMFSRGRASSKKLELIDDDDEEIVFEPVTDNILDILSKKWMLSWRARDISLLNPESVFDMPMLAYMLNQARQSKANILMEVRNPPRLESPKAQTLNPPQVCKTPRPELMHVHDSCILTKVPCPAPAGSSSSPVNKLFTVEVPYSSLCSPGMQTQMKSAVMESHGLAVVGMRRYMLHVPTLVPMLRSPVTFRPKLSASKDGYLRTRALKSLCVIYDVTDIEELSLALLAQDDGHARDAAGQTQFLAQREPPAAAAASAAKVLAQALENQAKARRALLQKHTYIVLLNLNNTSLCATILNSLAMLVRQDTDCVVLATVVMGESSVASAKTALEEMAAPLSGVKVSAS
eukprot:gene23965-9537_t